MLALCPDGSIGDVQSRHMAETEEHKLGRSQHLAEMRSHGDARSRRSVETEGGNAQPVSTLG